MTARSNAGATADLGNPAVQNWYDEINDYNYDDNKCSAVCGHYTQVSILIVYLGMNMICHAS